MKVPPEFLPRAREAAARILARHADKALTREFVIECLIRCYLDGQVDARIQLLEREIAAHVETTETREKGGA